MSDDAPKPDLDFVTTVQLCDELAVRFDAVVVAGLIFEAEDEHHAYMRWWQGGCLPCLALTDLLQIRLRQAVDEMDKRQDLDDPRSDRT